LADAHGFMELTGDGEKFLMLRVDRRDVNTVLSFPFKHILYIGENRASFE
jgi:hypothetical protein